MSRYPKSRRKPPPRCGRASNRFHRSLLSRLLVKATLTPMNHPKLPSPKDSYRPSGDPGIWIWLGIGLAVFATSVYHHFTK